MTTRSAVSHQMVLRGLSFASSLFLVAIGITVLAGWYFDVPHLKSIADGWATMKANTALSFVLIGASLWCLRDAAAPAHIVRAGQACAALVVLLVLIALAQYLLNTDFGVDQLFFRDVWNGEPGSYPGRMAPATAFCFLLAGSSLLGLDQTTARGHRPALGLSLGAGVIGLLAFAGYLFGVKSLYAFSPFTTMAAHTAASFVIFAVGTLCARPDKGPLGILAADGVGSLMARRLLPLAIVLPLLIGWLRLQGERAGFYGPDFGLALFAISNVALFAMLTWVTAVSLNRMDADRFGAIDALIDERARLAGLIDSAMDAVISIDDAQHIALFNPAAEAMFGRRAADVIGQPIEILIPERLRSGHSQQINSFGQTGVSNRRMGSLGVVTGLRADGTEFPLEASISQIEVKGRKFYTVILRDITDRRAADQALSENTERLKLAIQSADVGLWDWDLRSNEVHFSPEWKRQLGYREDEIANRFEEWENRCHPEDLPAARARVQAYLSDPGSRFESEFRMHHKDGTYRWIQSRAQLLLDPAGRPARMLGGHVDITRRKLAEVSLRESAASLAAAQALARIGNWRLDLAGGGGWWSAEMFSLLGFDPDLGVPEFTRFLDHVHPDDREAFERAHASSIAGRLGFEMEYRFVRPDGTPIWLDARSEPAFDQAGNLAGLAGTVQDITERKRADEEIRQLNADLERRVALRTAELHAKNKELETFSYSVSHDLKAPLRGIDGYSKLLLSEYENRLDDEARVFLKNIRLAAGQMQQLIDDLLAYSRLDQRSLRLGRIELAMLVEGVLKERAHDLEPVQVSVEVSPEPVKADREGLSIVLRNLVDNAVKFSRRSDPPVLEIRSRAEGARHIFSVRDNGTGFDMKYHDRIFQIFQRLHRAEDYSGTGVGLAIVHKAVERMGGRVWAESEPGKGATFHVDLPRYDVPEAAAT